jgi:hypothetical protein
VQPRHLRGSLQLVALVGGEVVQHLVDREAGQPHRGADRLAVVAARELADELAQLAARAAATR